jgi:hypothetical protein
MQVVSDESRDWTVEKNQIEKPQVHAICTGLDIVKKGGYSGGGRGSLASDQIFFFVRSLG